MNGHSREGSGETPNERDLRTTYSLLAGVVTESVIVILETATLPEA